MLVEKPFWKYLGSPDMAEFQEAYDIVKDFEGGWCDVEGDAGGETYAGIARNFFPEWLGWDIVDAAKRHSSFQKGAREFSEHLAPISALHTLVQDWYRVEWWDAMQLSQFPQALANELFEQAVNLGRGGSGRYVQRLCNAFNYQRTGAGSERLFDELKEDGVLGKKSLAALAVLVERMDTDTLVHALNGLQVAHYVGLGAKNFHHRKFMRGWLTRTHAEASS